MSNKDESPSPGRRETVKPPLLVQPPRSSIALGKRRVYNSSNQYDKVNPGPASGNDNFPDLRQDINQLRSFEYSPLDQANIRLVRISPSMQDGTLVITLDEAPLNDELGFCALSYVWGEETDKRAIIVNGQRLEVTQNLFDFLDTARKHESSFLECLETPTGLLSYGSWKDQAESRPGSSGSIKSAIKRVWWWIDAICINQQDLIERNEQVPRMGDIYSMASRVWIWMGLASKVFRSNPEFTDLKRALAFHEEDSAKWTGDKELPKPLIEQFADDQRKVIVNRSIARMKGMGISTQPGPAMDMMYQMYAQVTDRTPPQLTYALFNNFLKELSDLLGQAYFGRTWIIQEYIINPRRPIALIGNVPIDLDDVANVALRLMQERGHLNDYVKVHAHGVLSRMGNLAFLYSVRQRWHNITHESFHLSEDLSEVRLRIPEPKPAFSRLPDAEKLNYLLHAFFTRQCTNDLDRFYGILGFLDRRELPQYLLPDYSLSFAQVSWDYTRYIIENTRELRIIEAASGHPSADCPSWVPNVKHLTSMNVHGVAVSSSSNPFSLSEDGRRLVVEGTLIGEIISCSCSACPTEYGDKHLEFVGEVLLEGAFQITGRPVTELFKTWINDYLKAVQIRPACLENITSMQELLARYRDVCSDIPSNVLEIFNNGRLRDSDLHVAIFDSPCRDPELLYTVLRISRHRYCLLSSGHVVVCGLKNTVGTTTSPSHRWDDCAWALKGLHQLAILRSKGQEYEYFGPLRSLETLHGLKESNEHEFNLDDEFFATREVRQVVLV